MRVAWRRGKPGRIRYRLLLQSLYQVTADLRDPCFGPFQLLPTWPISEGNLERDMGRFLSWCAGLTTTAYTQIDAALAESVAWIAMVPAPTSAVTLLKSPTAR